MEIDIQARYLARVVAEEKTRRLHRIPVQLEQTPKVGNLLKNLAELFR